MKKFISIISLLVIALSACKQPTTESPGLSPDQQAATTVSQTLTAETAGNIPLPSQSAGTAEQPLASPTGRSPTLQPSDTPAGGTGTPTATTLTVDSNTNCRAGPGQTYKVVVLLVPGATYQISARTADNKYWILTLPNTADSCWVPAELSNAFGNVTYLPLVTPSAPTSSVGLVQAPTGLTWTYDCVHNGIPGNILVLLVWTDRSTNETGFRLYRDNVQVVELAANTTTYTDMFAGNTAVTYTYRVSAYNAASEAPGAPITFSCK